MATIGSTYLNIVDMMRQQGAVANADVVETLSRLSPVANNAVTVECNTGTSHRHSIRTNLPAVTWGRLYQGIPQSKSGRAQVIDTTGFVEGLSTVDTRLLEIAKNPAALRESEGRSFLESMAQEAETGFFYHDVVTTPEKFKGMAARYNTLAGSVNSRQVINGGGVQSDNTSAWFITWGENSTSLIHPEGTMAGVNSEDMGRQRVTDALGNPYYVKEEMFRWHLGVAVRDYRYNVRVANIDVSDVIAGTVDIYKFLRQGYHRLQNVYASAYRNKDGTPNTNAAAEGRTVLYMNRTLLEALDATQTNQANAALQLRPMELEGKIVQSYRGIPIQVTDALLNTEAPVT